MYVWALRDKWSEWQAVKGFLTRGRVPFVPLIEAVREPYLPAKDRAAANPVAVMEDLGEKVSALTDSGRVWIDLGHLVGHFSPEAVASLHVVVQRSVGLAAHLVTPVVRTTMPPVVVTTALTWAKDHGSGVCLRIEGSTHARQRVADLQRIVRAVEADGIAFDLVYDAQDLPLAMSHEELAGLFPESDRARTWVVLGGTFPASMADLKLSSYEHRLERGEWVAWREEVERAGSWRRPAFGDYATQGAVYSPSPSVPGSPTLRYTTGEEYVVLRGRGGKTIDYKQYVGHARYLRQQPYFRDVSDTSCDAYIDRIAEGSNGTGNLRSWRAASFERHVTVAAAQVANYAAVLAAK